MKLYNFYLLPSALSSLTPGFNRWIASKKFDNHIKGTTSKYQEAILHGMQKEQI